MYNRGNSHIGEVLGQLRLLWLPGILCVSGGIVIIAGVASMVGVGYVIWNVWVKNWFD